MIHRAVCPGSFDPITMGHVDIFRRAAQQFDEMVVLVTGNPNKPSGLFSISERVELAEKAVADLPNVTVDWWGGLLVDYTTKHDIGVIVKGLRSALDYEYEVPMAQMNRSLSGVDTMFFMTNPKYGHVSSTLCKEVIKYGGDIHDVLPPRCGGGNSEEIEWLTLYDALKWALPYSLAVEKLHSIANSTLVELWWWHECTNHRRGGSRRLLCKIRPPRSP